MNEREQSELLGLLSETQAAIQESLEGIDLDLVVYRESGWRVRDLLGHLATWSLETAKSLRAFQSGTEYFIPDLDEDDFNQQAAIEKRELSPEQVWLDWSGENEHLGSALREMPPEKFPGDLVYPWGDERGSIAQLVRYMCEHAHDHRAEILQASQAALEG